MTKVDREKLQAILIRLTAHFSDRNKQSMQWFLGRGDGRAIVAAIRELDKRRVPSARDRLDEPSRNA